MRRTTTLGVVMGCVLVVACSQETPVSPSAVMTIQPQGTAALSDPIGDSRNSCPDFAPVWLVKNSSTDNPTFNAIWSKILNIDTYEVEMMVSSGPGAPPRLFRTWRVNGNDVTFGADAESGIYYLRVRVKNRCDRLGAWSETLTVYMGPDDEAPPALYCPWEW